MRSSHAQCLGQLLTLQEDCCVEVFHTEAVDKLGDWGEQLLCQEKVYSITEAGEQSI